MKIRPVLLLLFAASGAMAQTATPLHLVLADVHFPANSSAVGSEAWRTLDAVATLLKATPEAAVEVGVHTDASGSTAYNLRLSQRRAQAVGSYLTHRGVAAKRVKTKGYGESQPINRCRRGTRCSEAEKRQNRRVELRVKNLPADSSTRAAWLALGGTRPQTATGKTASGALSGTERPPIPAMTATPTPSPVPTDNSTQSAVSSVSTDYFSELLEKKPNVPKPLPGTFTGYTIEIACTEKPLAADDVQLRKHETVFLRQVPGGPYCYYTGAFFTLPEARQFLLEKIRPDNPGARVAGFTQETRRYFEN